MKKNYVALSVAVALCMNSELFAQKVELDEVEVSSSAIGYSNIDAIKIQTKNTEMVHDILRDIPGVYVGGTNSFNQKIYMRGVNDRGLNITIDGARQKGNIFHHNADLIIDPDLLKSVDVGVGANSVIANSGALGGSVAFKTVEASDLLKDGQIVGAKIKGSFNSNDERYTGSTTLYTNPVGGLDLLGYFKYSDYDFGEDGNGNEIGGKGKDKSYLLKGSYKFLDSHKIGLSYEHSEYKGDYPFRAEFGGAVTTQTPKTDKTGKITGYLKAGERAQAILPQKMERDTYRLFYNYNPNDIINLDLNTYYTDHALVRDKMPSYNEAKKAGKASLMDGGVKTYGATLINTTKLAQEKISHTIKYGFEYYKAISYLDSSVRLSAKNGTIEQAKTPTVGDDKASNYSLFIEDAINLNALTITPGVRFDYYELDTMGEWPNRAKYDWREVSPALALDYQFNNGLGLFASYHKVFRGPDPIESIRLTESTAKGFKKSDTLNPEKGDAYEIGFRYSTNISDNNSVNFITKYFYTDYENLINEFASPYGVDGTTRVNAGEATVDGIEIAAKAQIENLGLWASYTHSSTNYKQKVTPAKKGQSVYGGILGYSDSGDKYTFGADYFISPADLLVGYNMIYFNSITTANGYKTIILCS